MAIENKIKRQIAFSPTTWERLNELSDRMDTPISTLVNLGIAWWMDYHDVFKEVPRMLNELARFSDLAEGLGAYQTKNILKSIDEGDAGDGSG